MSLRVNWISEISAYMENEGLCYGLFNYPSRIPHRLYISDTSTQGLPHGKFVIEGRTWKEVYAKLQMARITIRSIPGRPWHEAPDL